MQKSNKKNPQYPSFVTGYDADNENQDSSESDCEVFEMDTSER